jgi:hypothetical protein
MRKGALYIPPSSFLLDGKRELFNKKSFVSVPPTLFEFEKKRNVHL